MLNDSYYRLTAAQIVQANLADVGIKVEIIPLDSGPFWNLGLESKGEDWKNLQMWLMRYRTSPDPSDGLQWFVKSQVGVWNWERWSDPEFEDLWAKGLAESDDGQAQGRSICGCRRSWRIPAAYVWITHDPINFIHKVGFTPDFDPGARAA